MVTEEELLRLRKKFDDDMAVMRDLEERIEVLKTKASQLEERKRNIVAAREIIQSVSLQTQKNLEFHVSSLVTTAMKHVDEDWPDYKVEFIKRRNSIECDLFFEEKERQQHPLDGAGGGVVDVANFAQVISYWTLNKNLPFFFLDEPFRNVSPNLQGKVSEMLKMVCDKLGIQVVMISHAEDINMAADRTFQITKMGDKSEGRVV